jgi:hypothetical protein
MVITSRSLPGEGGDVMESLTSGTMAAAGSFRCEQCGYVVTLASADQLPACAGCGAASFARVTLFGRRFDRRRDGPTPPEEREALIAAARATLETPGRYLVYDDQGEVRVVGLEKEWTRIGRSLAADIRFDDPTVSRRHALIVRQPDGVRVLDDRSLNGVFVNGERVEWRALRDGDEIVVGRYRLQFLVHEEAPAGAPSSWPGTAAEA